MVIIKVEQKYRRVMRFIGRGFLRRRKTRIADRNGTNDPDGNTFYSDRSRVPQAHEWESLLRYIYNEQRTEQELAGIALKRPRMLRKHQKLTQGD